MLRPLLGLFGRTFPKCVGLLKRQQQRPTCAIAHVQLPKSSRGHGVTATTFLACWVHTQLRWPDMRRQVSVLLMQLLGRLGASLYGCTMMQAMQPGQTACAMQTQRSALHVKSRNGRGLLEPKCPVLLAHMLLLC